MSEQIIIKSKHPCVPSVYNDQIGLMEHSIQTAILTQEQKQTIMFRYISLLYEYKYRSRKYSCSYNTLRIIITVGSLIVPALLSVQYTGGNITSSEANISANVYWCVWVLSLLVTISNGLTALFKVDKKYFILNTTYQQLLSEGWQYIHLSGKFSGPYTPNIDATHKNQFIFFCNRIEKIRMKHVQEEYYKLSDNHETVQPIDTLVPPTPAKPFSFSYDEKSTPIVNGSKETTVRRKVQENTEALTTISEGISMDDRIP